MHWIDIVVFTVYMLTVLGIGVYFWTKNKDTEDYYLGGRSMGSVHIGLSVVATDVGGGFSIGLGGLGFAIGLSGSWMLLTGLIGAWLTAVVLIPRIRGNKVFEKSFTLPQIYGHYFGGRVAVVAGVISAVGYIGFTAASLLAGAKLAYGTLQPQLDTLGFEAMQQVGLSPDPGLSYGLNTALIIMGVLAVVYTGFGGIKAVIYTDTFQWALLLVGLVFIGLPIAYHAVGGWSAIRETVQPQMLGLSNVTWQDLANWSITIIPIWFVGMTLYQRIFASRDVKTAKRAWFLAGLFEYPVMAFLGVSLGLLARVAADQGMFDYLGADNISDTDPETGLPMLLRTVLPVGMMGLMLSAYFSAILSTADSCLMAASGNIITDIMKRLSERWSLKQELRWSQVVTWTIGGMALVLALSMTQVLDIMLLSYAFMVSGLLVPLLAALYFGSRHRAAALWSMVLGGATTALLSALSVKLPLGLDANFFGLGVATVLFVALARFLPQASR